MTRIKRIVIKLKIIFVNKIEQNRRHDNRRVRNPFNSILCHGILSFLRQVWIETFMDSLVPSGVDEQSKSRQEFFLLKKQQNLPVFFSFLCKRNQKFMQI